MSKKLTTEEFIRKAIIKHGNEYDYSKVDYQGTDKDVIITCKIHGDFPQTPHMHLAGQGCPFCYGNQKYTTETFIERAKEVHQNADYSYVNTIYRGIFKPITIHCNKHDDFTLTAHSFLSGTECPECSGKRRYDREYFIKRAREVHGDKYDYSLVTNDIKNNRQKVVVICPIHGKFSVPIDNHINQKQGCRKCKSSKMQKEIRDLLNENKINFAEEKTFEWLKTTKWTSQKLDFYLPDYNVAIECQGEQHFKPSNFGSKKITPEESFDVVTKRDTRKRTLCAEHGIKIIYYTNLKYETNEYKLIKNKEELINSIFDLSQE